MLAAPWVNVTSVALVGTGSVTAVTFFVSCEVSSGEVVATAVGAGGTELVATPWRFSVQASLPTLDSSIVGGALLVDDPSDVEFVITVATAPSLGIQIVFDLRSIGSVCTFSRLITSWASVTSVVLTGSGGSTNVFFYWRKAACFP